MCRQNEDMGAGAHGEILDGREKPAEHEPFRYTYLNFTVVYRCIYIYIYICMYVCMYTENEPFRYAYLCIPEFHSCV
jgi:hypothetical protein